MAFAGCGVWSLVGQRLVAMGAKAAMLWWIGDWRPSGRFDGASLRRMTPYSLRMLMTDLINTLYNNISQLFVGKIYSTQTLGYYNQGQKLKDLPVLAILQSVQNVTFPALSKIRDEREKFAESYRQLLAVVSFVVYPVMVGLIAVAPEFFALLLGEKWMPTVPYFEILCLSGLFMPLSVIAYNVLKSQSDGRIVVRLEVVKKVAMTLVLVYTIPRGVVAIAWGVVAMALLEWAINLVAASRYTALSLAQALGAHLPAVLLSGVMFLGVRLFKQTIGVEFSLFALLSSQILLGVLLYALLALLIRPRALRVLFEVVKGMRGSR
jgi:O-antigen/teichoic acid export membrane protein